MGLTVGFADGEVIVAIEGIVPGWAVGILVVDTEGFKVGEMVGKDEEETVVGMDIVKQLNFK